ncbi:hypothetical protein SUGI_0422220 [Cryptomeria japonica]|uniref:VQ motif-containing protein 25-like n=1 Tax=Cryptomeria japonica TaxID=3369 RepID=UPI002408DFBB|nr:VQ motif-containing protein 25-like [Cryptomeria japonica]GLJ22427.1 hypothetical protein SUGI_0422220 [Cryptomeria japonica]
MEGKRGQSGRLSTCKSSHVISKSNSSVRKITPVIRIVHICAPTMVNTDPANFRAIVQDLTGKHSSCSSKKFKQKKLNPTLSPQIPVLSKKMLRVDHSDHEALTDDEEENLISMGLFCSEEQPNSPLPQIKMDNDRTNFCGGFGGFGEIDIFTALLGSIAMLPEFPTITPPAIDQTDLFTGIFMTS